MHVNSLIEILSFSEKRQNLKYFVHVTVAIVAALLHHQIKVCGKKSQANLTKKFSP